MISAEFKGRGQHVVSKDLYNISMFIWGPTHPTNPVSAEVRKVPVSCMKDFFFLIGERAKRVTHPLLLPIEKNVVYIVRTSKPLRMLTILREAEEWIRVHLREACLLFASAITKSLLYVRQSACTSNNFTFARPLMETIF